MTTSDTAAAVLAECEQRREELVALCERLVAAPSANPVGDTREVAAVVAEALAVQGIQSRLERQLDHMPSVVAEIDSGRPGRHLVVNVHLDTMPPGDENAWSVPVWRMSRRDGRLSGLGMGNMKGAVAAMVHAVGMLNARSEQWSGRVTFLAVSDEVVFGENGAAYLLATHPDVLGNLLRAPDMRHDLGDRLEDEMKVPDRYTLGQQNLQDREQP